MSSTERVFEPEVLFQAHVEQLITWIKGQLKGRVQSASPRPKHPYSGPARLPAASVKDGRVIVTYYEDDWLQPIDVHPAPGANAYAMVSELQQAFSKFQPRDPVPETDEKPPPGSDSGEACHPVTLAGLEDYFERNPHISRYDRQHDHPLSLLSDQAYSLEVSGDGRYVRCAIRLSGKVIQYHLDPGAGIRAADLLEEVAAWLRRPSALDPVPSVPRLDEPAREAPAPTTTPPADPTNFDGAEFLLAHLRGLREHFRALQALGCTHATINAESTQLTFPDVTVTHDE